MMPLSYFFDTLAIAIIAFSAYFGLRTGAIASLFYIISGFTGMWAAQHFARDPGVMFYLVFFATAGIIALIGFGLSRVAAKLLLSPFDRIAGSLLGALLGVIIVGVIMFPLTYHLSVRVQQAAQASYGGRYLLPQMQRIFPQVKQFRIPSFKKELTLEIPDNIDIKISIPTTVGKKKK